MESITPIQTNYQKLSKALHDTNRPIVVI